MYAWMFRIFIDKYHEPEMAPIVRIMWKLGGIGKVIYHELEPWVRNPAGVWDWLGKIRNDLEALRRRVTYRGICNYFKECRLVKSHKMDEVIRKHCLTISFMGDLEESECDIPHG